MALRTTALALSLLLLAPGAALAQEAEILVTAERLKLGWKAVSAEVPFGDLDLSTRAGADTLNARVEAEVRNLCRAGTTAGERSNCRALVRASAQPQVAKLVADARAVAPAPEMR